MSEPGLELTPAKLRAPTFTQSYATLTRGRQTVSGTVKYWMVSRLRNLIVLLFLKTIRQSEMSVPSASTMLDSPFPHFCLLDR